MNKVRPAAEAVPLLRDDPPQAGYRDAFLGLIAPLIWSVWQVAELFPLHKWMATGNRTTAVLDLLLPTLPLAIELAFAARARGRSVGWGTLALLGPIGVAIIYRQPALPVATAMAPAPPSAESPLIVVAVTLAQVIVVVHLVATYPWDHRFQWVESTGAYLFMSIAMLPTLGRTLLDRAYPPAWAALAFLGPIGLAVIYWLPDRTVQSARGFQVEPAPPMQP